MRIRLMLPVALLALVLAACTNAPGATTGTADDEAAIRANSDAWAAAWNARDAAGIAALMSSDYHEVTPTGQHFSTAADAQGNLAAEFEQIPAGVAMSLSTEFIKFIDADHAYAGGTWTTTGMPAGMPTRGSWLVLSERDSTGWKYLSGLGSTDVTPMMATAPADNSSM